MVVADSWDRNGDIPSEIRIRIKFSPDDIIYGYVWCPQTGNVYEEANRLHCFVSLKEFLNEFITEDRRNRLQNAHSSAPRSIQYKTGLPNKRSDGWATVELINPHRRKTNANKQKDKAGDDKDKAGDDKDKAGDDKDKAGDDKDKAGDTPQDNGCDTPQDNGCDTPQNKGKAQHGKSGETPHDKGKAPQGKSGEAPHDKGKAPQGKSGDTPQDKGKAPNDKRRASSEPRRLVKRQALDDNEKMRQIGDLLQGSLMQDLGPQLMGTGNGMVTFTREQVGITAELG